MAFGLSRHYHAHKSDARCVTGCHGYVASGGRDCLLKLWLPGGEACVMQEAKWVNAVTSISPGRVKSCVHGGIVTGSQDGLIRIYSLNGQQLSLQHALQAHSAPVCSLSWLDCHEQLLLLSGGWDAVAKVWEVQSAEGTHCPAKTLCGHENNVCVLGLANGDVITGSSGVRDQLVDCVIGFKLRVWREDLVVQTISQEEGGHVGAIRDLAAIPVAESCAAFASASNDGTVSIWMLSTAGGKYLRALRLAVPSESFVFSVCYAAHSESRSNELIRGTIFTADDSGELCVFDLSVVSTDQIQDGVVRPVQRIRHPKTLWSVAIITASTESLGNEDSNSPSVALTDGTYAVATACADGAVRVFSMECTLHLTQAEQQKSLDPQIDPVGPSEDYTMSTTLPRASERSQFRGATLGTVSLFLDDEEEGLTGVGSPAAVVAFQWLDSDDIDGGRWVKLGRVLDAVPNDGMREKRMPEKQELDGEFFDLIIPVEVDSASRGQLSLLLGVNAGDDPKLVAATFCQKHGLMDEYIPQIALFVEASCDA